MMPTTRDRVCQTVLVEVGTTASCSGIIIDNSVGHIVTHASILLPFLSGHMKTFRHLLKSGQLDHGSVDFPSVMVTYEQHEARATCASKSCAAGIVRVSLSDTSASRLAVPTNALRRCAATISKVWQSETFAKTISRLFPKSEWKFWADEGPGTERSAEKKQKSTTNDGELAAEHALALLPYFVLINVGDELKQYEATNSWTRQDYQPPDIGNVVYVVGTPFGNLSPPVFLNSVSKGIISNIAGDLLLTDARCIPGTEGGAVYADSWQSGSAPLAMIVAPLCWKLNEWIGLSLACRLSCVLESLNNILCAVGNLRTGQDEWSVVQKDQFKSSVGNKVPVVLVRTIDGSWGSGVIVNQQQGLVLTCGHVVKTNSPVTVRLSLPDETADLADVLFSSKAGDVYDLAVLKLRHFKPRQHWPEVVDINLPLEADEVFVVGHAAWGIHYNLWPSVTAGVISRILYHKNSPVLIQTSSAVNAGSSGGPLISKEGRLLGIVVCNARDTINGACYPHINLCVPIVTIWNIVTSFIATQDCSVLRLLVTDDAFTRDIWSLGSASLDLETSAAIRSKL